MSFFSLKTVKPLKSDRVKKILSDEKLRGAFIAAIKDLREGGSGIFITSDNEELKSHYRVLTGETSTDSAIKLDHVKKFDIDSQGHVIMGE